MLIVVCSCLRAVCCFWFVVACFLCRVSLSALCDVFMLLFIVCCLFGVVCCVLIVVGLLLCVVRSVLFCCLHFLCYG